MRLRCRSMSAASQRAEGVAQDVANAAGKVYPAFGRKTPLQGTG